MDDDTAHASSETSSPDTSFPVVGVGCSAGGLEALEGLLEGLGDEPGTCVVLLHHTDPDREETLAPILRRSTKLPVEPIEDGDEPAANTVRIVPAGNRLELEDGRFRLEPVDRRVQHDVVDRFLQSLAESVGPRAIGVILSGSMTDGSFGLRDIKHAGGVTFAQDPDTAANPSMPRNAIEDGHADFVLGVREIGERIDRLGQEHLKAQGGKLAEDDADEEALKEILELVYDETGVDFSAYKTTTLARRIDRRRMARGAPTLQDYLELLEKDPQEAETLHDESLIHVTGFFRDPESFDALREEAFDHLETIAREDPPIRVWVPGCATGEEAYSLAIALHAHLDEKGLAPRVQLFGTDLSEEAVETAREGRYPRRIADDVPAAQLERYFVDEGDHYRVRESIRNECIFAPHNLVQDPPFYEIDLVSCRNLLIYLARDQQERVTATLHYALSEDGILMLGSSESLDGAEDLFKPLDREHRIFRKNTVTPPPYLRDYHPSSTLGTTSRSRSDRPSSSSSADLKNHADRVLLDQFAPPGVVVDEGLTVLQFRGDVGRYLSPVEGEASLELTRVAPYKLALTVRSMVDEAREDGEPKQREGVRVEAADGAYTLTVRVLPVEVPPDDKPRAYVALFLDDEHAPTSTPASKGPSLGGVLRGLLPQPGSAEPERVQELEDELKDTRRYLESVIEEYEATNEELRSANEEALSTNEELQSTNEELATAKEELQSANEELTSLNEELKERNAALQHLNDDLSNLLSSVDLPILMLDAHGRVRRFTPAAGELFNLREEDEGRPVTELQHPFPDEDFEAIAQDVLDSLQMDAVDVESEDGDRYELRVQPYRTQDNEITGTVLVFWGPEAPAGA